MKKEDEEKIHKQIYEEVLKEVENEKNSPEHKSLINLLKFLMIFSAILVIILIFLTYTGGGSGLEFLKSRVVSYKINGNIININNNQRIVFVNDLTNQDIYSELKQFYLTNQEKEFIVCLTGNKTNNDYYITGLYVPDIYQQTVYSVTSEQCNSETIIPMHSHPPNRCIFSDQDIESFNRFREKNPDAIFGVMCDVDRFGFYGLE